MIPPGALHRDMSQGMGSIQDGKGKRWERLSRGGGGGGAGSRHEGKIEKERGRRNEGHSGKR
eukprot:765957-Hanusia_phi.AAC.7